jgi:hypothetical protein
VKSLVATYDGYLRRKARQRDPRRKLEAFYTAVQAPWSIGLFVVSVCLKTLGLWFWLLLVPLLLLLMLGFGWATWRFNKHGVEFDKTPPSAPWIETEPGRALIQALARVAIGPLSALTLETRLRRDLKFNERDIYELSKLLTQRDQTDAFAARLSQSDDATVGDILRGLEPQNGHPKGL